MNKWDILIWGILLGIVLAIAGYKFLKCRKMKKILKRAKAGEKKAVVFLERAGYRVIEVQSRKKVITTIGGTDHESTVIADLIVRKGFFKYVVEVKTQGQAFPTLPNVRRQMMEYYLVFLSFISSRTSPTISGSSAEVGSSKSITSGFMARDLAMAIRCF